MEYILPVLIFALLAIAAGVLLTFLSYKFPSNTTDEVNEVRDALPGLNCGSCGFAGCDEYAEKCVKEKAAPNLCVPGGVETATKISKVTGVAFSDVQDIVAHVRCQGSYKVTSNKYDYRGVLSCAASSLFYGGRSACRFGCLGFGDCAEACPNQAITIQNGLASVNRDKCTGCLICTKICPKQLIVGIPRSQRTVVSCMSQANGKDTRNACKSGCIACKQCERVCPAGAIKVTDNHASVNNELCSGCGACVEKCPVKCIVLLQGKAQLQ